MEFQVLLEEDNKTAKAREEQQAIDGILQELNTLRQVQSEFHEHVEQQGESLVQAEDNLQLATHRMEQGMEQIVEAEKIRAQSYKQSGSILGLGIGATGGAIASGGSATGVAVGGAAVGAIGRAVGSVLTYFSNEAIDKEVNKFNKRNARGEHSIEAKHNKEAQDAIERDKASLDALHDTLDSKQKKTPVTNTSSSGQDLLEHDSEAWRARRAERQERRRNSRSGRRNRDGRTNSISNPTNSDGKTEETEAEQLAKRWEPVLKQTSALVQETVATSNKLHEQTETVEGMSNEAALQADILATSERVRKATSIIGRIGNWFTKDGKETIEELNKDEKHVNIERPNAIDDPVHDGEESDEDIDRVIKDLNSVLAHSAHQGRVMKQQGDRLDHVHEATVRNKEKTATLIHSMSLEL